MISSQVNPAKMYLILKKTYLGITWKELEYYFLNSEKVMKMQIEKFFGSEKAKEVERQIKLNENCKQRYEFKELIPEEELKEEIER